MFCTNCGTKFEGNFCPACGTPAAGVTPTPAAASVASAAPLVQMRKLSPQEEAALADDWPDGLTEEGMQKLYKQYRKSESSFACYLATNFRLAPEHATAIARKYMATHPMPSAFAWLVVKDHPTTLSRPYFPTEADRAHFRGERTQQEIAQERQAAEQAAERARIEENKRNGIPMCPSCKSTAIQAKDGRTFSLSQAMIGQALFGESGAAMGVNAGNRKKIEMVCLNCGRHWTMKLK